MEIAVGIIGIIIAAIATWIAYLQLKRTPEPDLIKAKPAKILPSPKPPCRRLTRFVDRYSEQGQDLVQLVKDALGVNGMVVVWGAGGVGKTALALEVAYQLLPTVKGVLWVTLDFYDDFNLSKLLNEICIQLEREDALTLAFDDKLVLARSLLSKDDYLLIIDGFEITREENAIIAFLKQVPSAELITSRRYVPGVHNIKLGPMRPPEAEALVRSLIQRSPEKQRLERINPVEIAQMAEGNPMVIQWVIGQLELAMRPDDVLSALALGSGEAAERVFNRSFSLLDDKAQKVLLSLSLFRSGATREMLGRVCDAHISEVNDAIAKLKKLALIDIPLDSERIYVTGLTRTLARAQLERDKHASLRLGFISSFLDYSKAFSQESPQSFDALERERENILAAIEQAVRLERWRDVIHFWQTVSAFLWVRGFWDDYVDCDEWTLRAAESLGDEETRAVVLSELGWVGVERADYARSIELIKEAYDFFKKADNEEWASITLAYLTIAELRRGNIDRAEEYCQLALTIAEREGYKAREGVLRNYLGSIYLDRGDIKKARQQYEVSLTIHREMNDSRRLMATLLNMGALEFREGNLGKARELYTHALSIATEFGQKDMIAGLSYRLAEVEEREGNLQIALDLARKAELLFRELRMGRDRKLAQEMIDRIQQSTTA